MSKKYIIDRLMLKPGDIILTAESAPVSKGVRLATASRYSHAAIWVGGTLIEATQDGVFSKNPQRIILEKETHAAVFRGRIPLTQAQTKAICEYARSQVGTLYALSEAIFALPMRRFAKLGLMETKKQFCSRLVALAYAESGYDLLNLRQPKFCTPRMISICKAFEEIPGVVREARPEEIAFAMTNDPVKQNQEQLFEWLNGVRNLVNSDEELRKSFDIQSLNDVSQLLDSHPELDRKICTLMRATEYLTFYNHDTKQPHLAYRYNRMAMIKIISSFKNPEKFLTEELNKEPEMLERFSIMLRYHLEKYISSNLLYHREHLNLYKNLLSGVHIRLLNLADGFDWIDDTESESHARSMAYTAHSLIETTNQILDKKY